MTAQELTKKLESVPMFVLQPPFEEIEYQFHDGKIYKSGKLLTEYSITEGKYPNHFYMSMKDVIKDGTRLFFVEYEDIIVNIDNDDEFPVFINMSKSRANRQFVILRPKKKEQ